MSDISIAPGIGISSTGLDAESLRMKVLANNMANAQAYGPDGEPYRRREVVFAERLNDALGSSDPASALGGVKVQEIVESDMPFKVVYRPGHPYADEEGFVKMPNVNTEEEMVDMMSASRSFQANLAAVKMSKSMANEALDLLKN
ncbi:MAG: flagellar basal body rod protein FlgC [Kiritimatiellae bacterium]|nr:flagellar basal body rod protein FlgC [Kiritimatiellia bacterium]